MSLFEVFIDANAKPTIEGYNALSKGILPKGIYTGGEITQGPGRSVNVAEFTAKSPDGFTVIGHTQNLTIVSPQAGDWAIVLYSRAWKPGDAVKQHTVEFRILPWVTQSVNQPGYSDLVHPDPDRDNYILFARVTSRAVATSVRIEPNDIDSSFAERIQINQPSTQVLSGTENFNGPAGVSIYHNLGHTNYRVQITPSQQPNFGIGDIWTEKFPTHFVAKCSGEVTTTLDWTLFVNLNKFGLTPQQVYGSRYGHGLISSANSSIIRNSEDSHNYFTFAVTVGSIVKPFVGCQNDFNQVTLSTLEATNTPVAWEMVSANVVKNLLIVPDVTIQSNSAQVVLDYAGRAASVKAFIIPKLASSLVNPIVTLTNNAAGKLVAHIYAQAAPGTLFTLVVFLNPGAYANGSVTNCTTSYEVVHNLDFNAYVPIISLRNIPSGTVTGMSVEIKLNSFKVHFTAGAVVSFDWIIVPAFVE
jgi:hypothetical protein